jgi:hypothetical protein
MHIECKKVGVRKTTVKPNPVTFSLNLQAIIYSFFPQLSFYKIEIMTIFRVVLRNMYLLRVRSMCFEINVLNKYIILYLLYL